MHPRQVREEAAEALAQGLSVREVARLVGVAGRTVRDWRDRPLGVRTVRDGPCTCGGALAPPMPDPAAYSHLLGLYLGDGCISRSPGKNVYVLRISCCDTWPGLQAECAEAIARVRP